MIEHASGLIMFDRYFQDLLVDPIRYRYGGPMWLPRLLNAFVPPPDLLLLVLDAAEEVILSRKRELPPVELRRQRASYQSGAAWRYDRRRTRKEKFFPEKLSPICAEYQVKPTRNTQEHARRIDRPGGCGDSRGCETSRRRRAVGSL
jgi:hypothetical protein